MVESVQNRILNVSYGQMNKNNEIAQDLCKGQIVRGSRLWGWEGGGNQIKIASRVINDQLVYVNNIHFPDKLIYILLGTEGGKGTHIDAEYGKSIMTSYRIND